MTAEQGIAIGIVVLIGYIGWGLTAIALYHVRRQSVFDPRELKELSPKTKAILLKYKDEILSLLGGKG